MRIPYPERISLWGAAVFATLLFLVQQMEGTALYFSAGCAAFILIATLAFNIAGGLTRASGAYIFFYAVLVFIVGVTYKAWLGEAAQTNLRAPKTDILVYLGGISGMLVAALISRAIRPRKPLLKNVLPDRAMFRASVGCIVFGIVGGSLIPLLGEGSSRLNSAFTQLNNLVPLGIIIGVVYEIRSSGGRRSINLPVLMGATYYFLYYGIINLSKQGMLTPIVCWALPVCAMRYRLTVLQLMTLAAGVFLTFYLLVPYSQYTRRIIPGTASTSQRVAVAEKLFSDPAEIRRGYQEDTPAGVSYYNTAQGFWDRLNLIYIDDAVNNITDEGRVFGLYPVVFSLLNTIPHVFWPGKPSISFGNLYAHEIDLLSPGDTTTGVSFSPTAEAYHMRKWLGLLVVAPLLWLMFFAVYDLVIGDLRSTPWGLLVLVLLAHTAPEGALTGNVLLVSFYLEALVFCAFFAAWVAPYVAILVLGPARPAETLDAPPRVPVRSRRALDLQT